MNLESLLLSKIMLVCTRGLIENIGEKPVKKVKEKTIVTKTNQKLFSQSYTHIFVLFHEVVFNLSMHFDKVYHF